MVATTGYRGDSEEVRQVGIQGYLTAPIKEAQLYDCILTVMHLGESSDTLITRHSLADTHHAERGQVLLVEDDSHEQKHLLSMIEDLDYRPYLASSSREAVQALSRQGYEYVIVDCSMECRDQFLVTEFIRGQRSRDPDSDIRVFAFSRPETSSDEVQECLSSGVVEATLDADISSDLLRDRLSAA